MSVPSPALASPQLQTKAAPAPITPSQRRPTTSRSIGFTPSSATDNDWRERDMLSPPGIGNGGYSPSKVVSGGVQASPRSAGPGKTIGGFDKKDNGKDKDKEDKDKDGKSEFRRFLRLVTWLGLVVEADNAANLAHVPCRFFKQGACTAGDSCPFSHSLPERESLGYVMQ
jgi:hypothetical protein